MQSDSTKLTQSDNRQTSIDSTDFFDSDDYDEYDNYLQNQQRGGGVGKRIEKRQENRGGGSGSGNVYSTKHTRAKDAQRENNKKSKGGKK